jgi:membrane protease YdiL (CAAX protease family)
MEASTVDDEQAPRPRTPAKPGAKETPEAAPRAAAPMAGAAPPPDAPPDGPQIAVVTWGWVQAVAGLVLAVAPLLLLMLLPQSGTGGRGTSAPTTNEAFLTVAVTVVIDGWYLVAAWIFSLRGSHAGLGAWGFRRPARSIFWAVPLALVAVYAVSVIYNLLVQTKTQDIIESFPRNAAGSFLFILLACAVAPFFEETFFRGFLFQGFARSWGPLLGAIASAAIFSLSHQQLDIFVPLFALGLALAWVYHVSRSVWGSIALHAVYNGIAVIAWLAGG